VLVIGDTPYDIKAARGVGVHSIGVASGGSTIEALKEAGADVVLPDLRDGTALRTAVFGAFT
jgi:phosphoglycolate phosphatase-like HAD superfamily hydrolase